MTTAVLKDLKLPVKARTLSFLIQLASFFSQHNLKAYIVGGFVRNLVLKRDTTDIDIALEADAPEIAPSLAAALGGKHILLDEVNRLSRVAIASRKKPKDTVGWQLDLSTAPDGILKDLKRRDFTINAMAIDLSKVTLPPTSPDKRPREKTEIATCLIDPSNGLDDLHHGVIQTVSEKAFKSDALRLLRAVRLAAELGFTISKQTEALIRRQAHLITTVAAERIREELVKLLAAPQAEQFLSYLDELGLITALIPELAKTKGVLQPREHTWDVFNHSVKTVAAVDFILRQGDWPYADGEVLKPVPWSTELGAHFEHKVNSGSTRRILLKLAALLHDIAKPQTKVVDSRGRTRFFGHPRQGAPIAAHILERLRFSSKEVRLVEGIIRYHLRPVQISRGELPSPRAVYRYFRDTGEVAIDALFFSLADHLATRGPDLDMANWQEHAGIVAYVLSQRFKKEGALSPPKLIDGHDLINSFSLSPGPKLGQLLEAVREAHASGEISNREEALSYISNLLTSKEEDNKSLPPKKDKANKNKTT